MAFQDAEATATGSDHNHRPLAGRSAWLITDGKTGMDVQARGVADALGVSAELKHIKAEGAYRLLAPYYPAPRREFTHVNGLFQAPWPDLIIASGRVAIPYLRLLRKRAGLRTFTVFLLDPRVNPRLADLVWVPEHDHLRGPNIITTLTSPHSFSQARLTTLRSVMPEAIAALPKPRVAVVLGGKSRAYDFTDACGERLKTSLQSLAAAGASFMITPSRRTHDTLRRQVREATDAAPRIFWDGDGPNPYPDFLAHADAVIVTADSINMCGEACATGKPVYVFTPSGGSEKFTRFHDALTRHGATKPLPPSLDQIGTWTYAPIDSAARIAAAIETRWLKRKSMLGSMHHG